MKALCCQLLVGLCQVQLPHLNLANDPTKQVRKATCWHSHISNQKASKDTYQRLNQLAGQCRRRGHSPTSRRSLPLPVEKCLLSLNVTQEGVMVHSALSLRESGYTPEHEKCSLWPYTAKILRLRDVTFTASLGGMEPCHWRMLSSPEWKASLGINLIHWWFKNEVKTVKTWLKLFYN